MVTPKDMQRSPATWHKCSKSSLECHSPCLQHHPVYVKDFVKQQQLSWIYQGSFSGHQLHLKSRYWPTVWAVCNKWLGAKGSFSELSDNERTCFSQACSLTATFNEDTYWDSQHLRWWDHQLSSAMKGTLFFHPSSYWRLLRETARDELSQLKSLGLLNLVGWLAGQHCCNTEMTQPHSIFVGILLAAVETSISLLLNRVCQWLGALMWKM